MNRLELMTGSSPMGHASYDFQHANEHLELSGPTSVLAHSPDLLQQCNGLQKALTQMLDTSGLPKHVQDVAILVVGARTQALHEIYVHSRTSGFPQSYLNDIRNGFCPDTLDDQGKVAFEVATALGKPGSLPEATWQKAVEVLGVEGATALIQCIGFHTFMSTISNGFDVQLPSVELSRSTSASSALTS